MTQTPVSAHHSLITHDYARWTVLSALRRGAIRQKSAIYAALAKVDFSPLFDSSLGGIDEEEFSQWHDNALAVLVGVAGLENQYGWAAKILNVYLKTTVYVGGLGRSGLIKLVHPPIDTGLWGGLLEEFPDHDLLRQTHRVQTIVGIASLATYHDIIDGMRQMANMRDCLLIELEQFWLN